jgi:hypothetical protein
VKVVAQLVPGLSAKLSNNRFPDFWGSNEVKQAAGHVPAAVTLQVET